MLYLREWLNEYSSIYFAGFLDSGKTTFINDTLSNPDFYNGEDTLLISFEEGEVPYQESILKEQILI